MVTKENQIASLGGRLIGDSNTAGQSDNQIKLKDRNEQSLLLNVTTVINENFTDLLIVLSNWMNELADKLEFRVNQDFLIDAGAAREFRAITMMYQGGILPIEVIYEYFLKADVIPEYVTLEVFMKMLEDQKQFPNNPDIAAKGEGFPDARAKVGDEFDRDELEEEARQFDEDLALRKKTEKAKPPAPKPVPVVPGKDDIPPAPNAARQANIKDG